jgi:hypothetical protein
MEIAAGSQRLQRGITAGAERLQLGICAAGGIQLHGTVWRLILSFFSIVQYFVAYLLDFTYIPPPAVEMDPFISPSDSTCLQHRSFCPRSNNDRGGAAPQRFRFTPSNYTLRSFIVEFVWSVKH